MRDFKNNPVSRITHRGHQILFIKSKLTKKDL
jgi:hypothetical protein